MELRRIHPFPVSLCAGVDSDSGACGLNSSRWPSSSRCAALRARARLGVPMAQACARPLAELSDDQLSELLELAQRLVQWVETERKRRVVLQAEVAAPAVQPPYVPRRAALAPAAPWRAPAALITPRGAASRGGCASCAASVSAALVTHSGGVAGARGCTSRARRCRARPRCTRGRCSCCSASGMGEVAFRASASGSASCCSRGFAASCDITGRVCVCCALTRCSVCVRDRTRRAPATPADSGDEILGPSEAVRRHRARTLRSCHTRTQTCLVCTCSAVWPAHRRSSRRSPQRRGATLGPIAPHVALFGALHRTFMPSRR